MRLKGIRAVIEWGYDTAATLNGWSIAPQKGGTFRLSATVVDAHPFNVTQKPLTFVAPVQNTELRLSVQTLTLERGVITATVVKET